MCDIMHKKDGRRYFMPDSIVNLCGIEGKECGICYCADGNCIASMNEDFYMPATEEQVKKRLADGRYPLDREAMEKYLEKLICKKK